MLDISISGKQTIVATLFLSIPHLVFWSKKFGITFYAQKCCFSQFFYIYTGFYKTNSHKMPDLQPT